MVVYILNSAFAPVAVVDVFKSLIWSKRYYTCGDFELYIPANEELRPYLQKDNFVVRDDDDTCMIIERLDIQTDAENGNFFIVTGRSLESILSRRVVLYQTVINAAEAVKGISELITKHTGNGRSTSYRAFPGLSIDSDSFETGFPLKAQFTGDNLLKAVSVLCKRFEIGFKISLSGADMVLSFYQGNDTAVIFSPEFDNLINSDYASDSSNLANYAVVAGEGEGTSRILCMVSKFSPSARGFDLREIFVDARDISSNNGEIGTMDYVEMLRERGLENLAEHEVTSAFSAEVSPELTFTYKTDYDLGDTVTVKNEYGITAKPRITEIIESWDDTGYKVQPVFDVTEAIDKTILRDSTGSIIRDSSGAIVCVEV